MKKYNAEHIVLITSGQLSVNPRLVKEADALWEAGYQVTVICLFWTSWADKADLHMLKTKKWRVIRTGGDPINMKGRYFLSRIVHRIAKSLLRYLGPKNGLAEAAIGRAAGQLRTAAERIEADLFIAHNLAALPAAVCAAVKWGVPCGFDAEDYHRHDISDNLEDPNVGLKIFIEQKYLARISQMTASSLLIAKKYCEHFPGLTPQVIRNVFPKCEVPDFRKGKEEPVRLFWFSQTIGPDRGIESVLEELALSTFRPQLHLLGACDERYKQTLKEKALNLGLPVDRLVFLPPVPPLELLSIASLYDIGIASEIGTPINRDICLTNKLFTYIQCGLVVLASNTTAQANFLQKYSGAGYLYDQRTTSSLASLIDLLANDRTTLEKMRAANHLLGSMELNWEIEKVSFLRVVNQTLLA